MSWHTTGTQTLSDTRCQQGLRLSNYTMEETDLRIEQYLEETEVYWREQATIRMLELELRKRRVKSLRLRRDWEEKKKILTDLLTDGQKKDISQQLEARVGRIRVAVEEEARRRLGIGDCSWMGESDEPADLWFDVSIYDKPNVKVSYPSNNRPAVVIDIAKSVRRDPNNIGHPLIVAAIARYTDRLETRSLKPRRGQKKRVQEDSDAPSFIHTLTYEQAEERLNRIFAELIAGVKKRSRRLVKNANKFDRYSCIASPDFDDDYFLKLSAILKENEVKRLEKLPTSWKSSIKTRLKASMPDQDHQRVLDFLSGGKLPRKRTAPALRNAFSASELGVSSASLRRYRSEQQSFFRRLFAGSPPDYDVFDFLDKKSIATEAANKLMLHLGIGKIDAFIDVDTTDLVWEKVVPKPNPTDLVKKKFTLARRPTSTR